MKLINKIKRKSRNRKLSKFADKMFYVSRHTNKTIFLHPLIFEIIRFRHFGEMFCTLKTDNYVIGGKNYFQIVTLLSEYEGVI